MYQGNGARFGLSSLVKSVPGENSTFFLTGVVTGFFQVIFTFIEDFLAFLNICLDSLTLLMGFGEVSTSISTAPIPVDVVAVTAVKASMADSTDVRAFELL